MRLFLLFIESFRVASQLRNARGTADIDRARHEIGAYCNEATARKGVAAPAGGTTIFDHPFAKQA